MSVDEFSEYIRIVNKEVDAENEASHGEPINDEFKMAGNSLPSGIV